MVIKSSAFLNKSKIPNMYGKKHEDISPPLTFLNVPKEAQSLALIMDDPDAPGGIFTHWVLYNIPPSTDEIAEGETPPGSLVGVNDYGKFGYGGPQPPNGTHRYIFKIYALDKELEWDEGANSEELQEAMEGHILDQAELTGLFSASG